MAINVVLVLTGVFLSDLRSAKALLFHNRSSNYVAAKATYIRLLHGKIGFLGVFRP